MSEVLGDTSVSKKEGKKKKEKEKKSKYQHFDEDAVSTESFPAVMNEPVTPSSVAASTSPKTKKTKSFKLPTKKNLLKMASSGKDEKKVRKLKQKHLKSEVALVKPTRPVFGVPLTLAVMRSKSHDGIALPACFRECLDFIETNALHCEGIYRVSGVKSKVGAVIQAFNCNLSVDLADYDPFVVASVLKNFIRELPECLLTDRLKGEFEKTPSEKDAQIKVSRFISLLSQLPAPNYMMLAYTLIHMSHVIQHQKENKMSLQNVSIVLSPTMQISHRVLHAFFTHLPELFPNVTIQKYVAPLRPNPRMEIPETLVDIDDELAKQESLLAWLHDELNYLQDEGVDSTEKSNLLWEVQLVVTALKRKKSLIELDDVEQIEQELSRQEVTLSRLHAALTGRPAEDLETQDKLWEVQRTITMLKRKLRKSGKPRNLTVLRASSSAEPLNSASRIMKSPSLPGHNFGIHPGMSALQENLELNLALRKVDESDPESPAPSNDISSLNSPSAGIVTQVTAVVHSTPAIDSGPVTKLLNNESPSQNYSEKPHSESNKESIFSSSAAFVSTGKSSTLPVSSVQSDSCTIPSAEDKDNVFNFGNSLRQSFDHGFLPSRLYSAPDENEETDLELYDLTRYPPPPEVQELEENSDVYSDEEDEDRVAEAEDNTSAGGYEMECCSDVQDLDNLAYRQEEENQLLCASEVEEEAADLIAMGEDLRRLTFEAEEFSQISDDLNLRILRECQEIDRLKNAVSLLHEKKLGSGDLMQCSSSSSSSDSEEEGEVDLTEQLVFFTEDNQRLKRENDSLQEKIHSERMLCAEYKVQVRIHALNAARDAPLMLF